MLWVVPVVVLTVVGALLAVAIVPSLLQSTTWDGRSKPTVALSMSATGAGANALVAGIDPPVPPSNFKVNIENVSGYAFGMASTMPLSPGDSVFVTVDSSGTSTAFSITWQNPSGSGVVSQGDTLVIAWTSGAYSPGTAFLFVLVWSADGSVLASGEWLA